MEKSVSFKLPEEGLKGLSTTRNFSFVVDEPTDEGGSDLGPTPMEYAYGALASCIAITLRMYAERKAWNTGEIKVEVYNLELENGTQEIHKKVSFGNVDLTPKQLQRLYKITEICPVSKLFSLENNIVLDQI